MTYKDQTASYDGIIYALRVSNDYIYVGGATTLTVRQYQKSDMAYVGQTASYGGIIYDITDDGTYIYAVGATTQRIRQYWRVNLTYRQQSEAYGGTIQCIDNNGDYISIGGATTLKVRQYWKSNMTRRQESGTYGGIIYDIKHDSNFMYVGGATDIRVRKLPINNIASVKKTISYGGDVRALIQDSDYVYAAGATTLTVRKYQKSDMLYLTQSASYGATLYALAQDEDFIYAGGLTTQTVQQYWKTNMTTRATSAVYGGTIWALDTDDTYVYAGGATTQTVRRYWKSNMTYKDETPSYGGIIYAIRVDGTYIYVGGATTNRVYIYWKSNMTYKGQANTYGGIIYALLLDDNYVYAAGATTQRVRQYWQENLTYIQQSASYGNTLYALTQDNEFIYTGGTQSSPNRAVWQIWKNNMTKKDQSPDYGGIIYALAWDRKEDLVPWMKWNNANNPDTTYSWNWSFDFLNGTGYYEFYSIGKTFGESDELAPSVADAICYYLIINTPPVLTNETPKNASINIDLNPILSIQVNDSEGQLMNITWYWGEDESCPYLIGTNSSIGNSTYFMTNDNNFSAKSKTYYWRITVNDGNGGWTNITFHFKTIGINKEIISKEKTAYSLEISADSTVLYGFINNVNVTTPIDTNWHYVVLTYDGTTIKLYEDGELKNSTTLIGNIPTNNNDLMFGDRLTGTLDELRVSSVARSSGWINTTYKMTNSPASFIKVEAEQNQQYTYLRIKIKNTGSTTIKTLDSTILINGTDKSFIQIQPCLYPLKETNIFVNVSVAGSKRNKFITGNGITYYEGYG